MTSNTYDDPARRAQMPTELRKYIPTRDIANAAADEIERLRSGVAAIHSYIENSTDRAATTLEWVAAMVEVLAVDNGRAIAPFGASDSGSSEVPR